MDKNALAKFEDEQYDDIGAMEAEMARLKELETELALNVAVDSTMTQGLIEKLAPRAAGAVSSSGDARKMTMAERRERIEKLHAERGAKLDRIKMQRHMLVAEQSAIASELTSIKNSDGSNIKSRPSNLDVILSRKPETPKDEGRRPSDGAAAKPAPFASNIEAKALISQLKSSYHDDRRRLEKMRHEQEEVDSELKSLQENQWKPPVQMEQDEEKARREMERLRKDSSFEEYGKSAMGASQMLSRESSEENLASEAFHMASASQQYIPPPTRHSVEPSGLASFAQAPSTQQHTHQQQQQQQQQQQPPQQQSLHQEIAALKATYTAQGGNDPMMLEAIRSLERDAMIHSTGLHPAGAAGMMAAQGGVQQQPMFHPPNGVQGDYGRIGGANMMFPPPAAAGPYGFGPVAMMGGIGMAGMGGMGGMSADAEMQRLEAELRKRQEEQEVLRRQMEQQSHSRVDPVISHLASKVDRLVEFHSQQRRGDGDAAAPLPLPSKAERVPLTEEEEELR